MTWRIRLTARRDRGNIFISVRNTGPPVPPEEIPRVFDRLFRGEYARHSPGSGLGLTIARQIAELHGGSIAMQSTEADGTTVSITLPDGTMDNRL